MILRSPSKDLFLLLSLALLNSVYSLDFDCHVTVDDQKYDLTSLSGEQILNRTRSTPPSTMVDSLRFDLCAELARIPYLPDDDQVSLDQGLVAMDQR